MHVVQIVIMHINALKTQLMHKNVQTNPEKSQKLTALCRRCEFRKLCYGGCPKHRFISLENEPNPHNYLCASYRYFFEQTAPYIQAMARQIRLHTSAA